MKNLLCILLALVMVLSLAACTIVFPGSDVDDDDDDDTKTTNAPKDPTEDPADDPTDPKPTDPVDDPSDDPTEDPSDDPVDDPTPPSPPVTASSWQDFIFKLDGVTYEFPGNTSSYLNNGWAIHTSPYSEPSDVIIPGKDSGYGYLVKEDTYFDVYFQNESANASLAQNCFIREIDFAAYKEPDLELFGGITFTSTADNVLSAWGQAAEIEYEDDGVTIYKLKYVTEKKDAEYKYSLYFDEGVLDFVYIVREVTETVSDPPVVDRRPEYLDEYFAPTALGTNVLDPIFLLDGVLYQLPCPASEFLNNGWRFMENDPVPGLNTESGYTLAKGTMKIEVKLMNNDNDQMLPKNCAVYGVTFDTKTLGNLSSVTLSNNVSISMSRSQAITALEGIEYSDYTYSTSFNAYDIGKTNYISWFKDFYYSISTDGRNVVSLSCDDWAIYPWLTTESIHVYTMVPSSWDTPCLWAWEEGGNDAFSYWPGEAMTFDGSFYSVRAPKWINYVIINGDNGTLKTDDIAVESGCDVWVIINSTGTNYEVFYSRPTEAEMDALGY